MSPIVLSLISFLVIMGGVLFGAILRNTLPDHHLAEDSRDVVRLGAGLVGTIAALVLGLLIASAKSSFDTQSSQVQRMTADLVLVDGLLAQYGPVLLRVPAVMPEPAHARPLLGGLCCKSRKLQGSKFFAKTRYGN
jgi:hypothetical protein